MAGSGPGGRYDIGAYPADLAAVQSAMGLAPCNSSATVDPTASNDSTQGYVAGSLWFNTATGVVFICRSATASAADWCPVGLQGAAVPSGAHQFPDHFIGGTTPSSALGALAGYVPFTVAKRGDFAGLDFWLVAAGTTGCAARSALYTSSGGRPAALIANTDSGAIDLTTGAGTLKAGNFSQTVTLEPNLYWGWWSTNGTGGPTVPRYSGSSGRNINAAFSFAPTGGMRVIQSGSYGAPASTASTFSPSQTDFPVLLLRAA